MEETWWREDENQIAPIEYNDNFIIHLAGRQHEGEWEYAIVHWRYTIPTLKTVIRSGKIVYSSEE